MCKKVRFLSIFVANTPDSWVVLYWSFSVVLDDFWSSGQYDFGHSYGLCNWAQEKSRGEYVNIYLWMYIVVFAYECVVYL